MVIAIAHWKGGVGKTTTAIHLAAYLQTLAPTLLLDGDSNHSAYNWANRANGLPFRVAHISSAAKLGREFDHTVIDTEKMLNDDDLKALVDGCDLLIIPAVPAGLDSDGLAQTLDALKKQEATNYRVLITKNPPANEPEGQNLRDALKRAGVPAFKTAIPRLKAFDKAGTTGVLVSQVDDPRAQRAWEAYEATGREVIAYGKR